MRQNYTLGSDFGQMPGKRSVIEMKLHWLVEEIGFHDEKVCSLGGLAQALHPFGIAGIAQRLSPKRMRSAKAGPPQACLTS